ncbi:MAG: ATP-binding response regulator [Chloroflexota bacterium]
MDAHGGILVVDDEAGMREACRWVLTTEGYQVELAVNGKEGLDKLRKGAYEVALIDLKMPGLDGLELLRLAHEQSPDTVCIMITGYATLDTAVDATKRGAYEFISKPFTPEELTCSVQRALERRRFALEARRLREEMERNMLQLSTEKSRIRSIVNCMVDGVVVTNRDNQLVLINPSALRMLRIEQMDVIGRPVGSVGLADDVANLMTSQLAKPGVEMAVREFNAGETVLMANVATVRDEQGEALGSVAVLRDITQMKALDKLKSQFVRMVAHELRAPLGAISQYLDVIINGAVAGDPERQVRMLTRCQDRANTLLGLIDDLLDLSSIEAGRVARNLESVQVEALVMETVEVFRAQAEARDITVTVDAPAGLPPVLADRRDMGRVFTNLLSNAIKYNRNGGKVTVTARREGGRLCVQFADSGYGIPEEARSHLFEEFFRVKLAETERVTGTGLGLSIVKRLVEAHQGYVTAQSKLGIGSTFSVYLPIPPSSAKSGLKIVPGTKK